MTFQPALEDVHEPRVSELPAVVPKRWMALAIVIRPRFPQHIHCLFARLSDSLRMLVQWEQTRSGNIGKCLDRNLLKVKTVARVENYGWVN